MTYSYWEAINLTDISAAESKREVEKHGLSWDAFVSEVGEKAEYEGAEILNWIGY